MNTPVIHRSFTIERTYPTTVDRVFRGFSDPVRKRRWFAEGEGFIVDDYTLEFREGHFERCRFRFGAGGPPMTLDCVFLDIQPKERIVFAYSMTIGGAPLSSSLGTTEFVSLKGGTLLRFTEHTAFTDGKDGSEGRREGSVGMLERLATEIESHP
jgi:uncharacterized protein YndB with AHSA1/START domain